MMHFLRMGGYAAYVWSAYGVTFIGLAGAIVSTVRSYVRFTTLLSEIEHGARR